MLVLRFLQLAYWRGVARELAGDNVSCDLHHVNAANFGHQRHGTAGAWVCFQNVHGAVLNGVLDVHQAAYVHGFGNATRVFLDGGQLLVGDVERRQNARGVARVDARKLDVLHNGRDECVRAVADSVGFAFQCVIQEAVNQDGPIRGNANCGSHVVAHVRVVVHNFHAASAQNIRGAHHNGVANLVGDFQRLVNGHRKAALGHGDFQVVHDFAEAVAVFCQVDDFGAGAQNLHTGLFQLACNIQRRLASELGNYAQRLLLLVNGEHVFGGQRLKVQLVGRVVVGGNRFRVAVDDDSLKTELLQRYRGVHAAVVELDALANAVGAAAQDHDLAVVRCSRVVGRVVRAVIIGAVLGAKNVHGVPCLGNAQAQAVFAHIIFVLAQQLRQVAVAEAVHFRLFELFGGQHRRGVLGCERQDCLFFFDDFLHLLNEVVLDLGQFVQLFNGSALAQRFVHDELTL